MVDLSGVAEIKCSKCNNVFDVDGSDIYVEAIGSDEKNMACGTFYTPYAKKLILIIISIG